MIEHSSEYDAAVTADSRRQYIRAVFDLVDPDAEVVDVNVSDASNALSETTQVAARGTDEGAGNCLSLEWNRWALDGTQVVIPNIPSEQDGQVGWVSEVLSGEDGSFSTPPYVEIIVSNVQILQAVTFLFSEKEINGHPIDFTVQIYNVDNLLYEKSITGNDSTLLVVDAFTVSYPTRVRLTITNGARAIAGRVFHALCSACMRFGITPSSSLRIFIPRSHSPG